MIVSTLALVSCLYDSDIKNVEELKEDLILAKRTNYKQETVITCWWF